MNLPLDRKPVLVALAGSNGAGKTTFYHTHLAPAALRLVNADVLAKELNIEPYEAATLAGAIRQRLLEQRESFVFETVFSDPAGDKLAFFQRAIEMGYNVVLCFIAIRSAETSDQRVAMRVSQGGHDVAQEKLITRFPRTMANLKAAIATLPNVFIFDNENLEHPYQLVARFENGAPTFLIEPMAAWLRSLLPEKTD